MTTLTHEAGAPEKRTWSKGFPVRDVSVSLAIAVMWIVVLLDALLGPDIVSSSAGASYTRVPSAVIVAFFAYLATRIVAKWGFGPPRDAE